LVEIILFAEATEWQDPKNPGRNRGFAFVEYYNHACAEHARRVMSKPSFRLGSNAPTISWADPRSGLDASTMSQVKVVYVRNLPDSVTEEQLQKLFEHHGEVTKVVLPSSKPGQAKRDFGFVHFSDRASALKAIEKTEVYELEGKHLLVPILHVSINSSQEIHALYSVCVLQAVYLRPP
jgi:heterogeneous nuclear ribonucleoprotein R